MNIETMDKKTGPRMKAFLERIAADLGCGEVDERCDGYGYTLFICPSAIPDDGVDVTYELCDSWEYEGEGEPRGVAPGVMIVRYGGEILGQIQPYNYTEECWVVLSRRDAQAQVEERMDGIEASYDEIVCVVQEAQEE